MIDQQRERQVMLEVGRLGKKSLLDGKSVSIDDRRKRRFRREGACEKWEIDEEENLQAEITEQSETKSMSIKILIALMDESFPF